MKKFLILRPDYFTENKIKDSGKPLIREVPFHLIAEHEEQAKINHGQSFERLNERGGLSPKEFYAVIHDLRFNNVELTEYECHLFLEELLK